MTRVREKPCYGRVIADSRACGTVRARYRDQTASCSHIRTIEIFDPPAEVAGCEECLELGMQWVHLRMCQSCGHIGCCDNSEGKHATAHNAETGHPVIRSVEPGEDWSWCYEDELMFRLTR